MVAKFTHRFKNQFHAHFFGVFGELRKVFGGAQQFVTRRAAAQNKAGIAVNRPAISDRAECACSLNIMLMTLPNELIDYVLLHELTHTKYMNHSPDFWRALEEVCPDAKQKRRFIKRYSPYL